VDTYDPRITPARPDLAARHLEGRVTAARFVTGEIREVVEPSAPVRTAPHHGAPLATEVLLGERVTIYEDSVEGWSWGQLESDGYVGFIPSIALGAPTSTATHMVSARRTFVFPGPSIKLPPQMALSFGARIAIASIQEPFAVTAQGGYLPASHVTPRKTHETDFVTVAEKFLGAPYLWGGKTSDGIDCSGLVQVALTACGIACPRDSDMQQAALSISVESAQAKTMQRGDLIFWKGHIAIARGDGSIIHANAHHMAVATESATDAITRILAGGSAVTGIRRIAKA
jgi:cell wall-associated NlpC family hydrolase